MTIPSSLEESFPTRLMAYSVAVGATLAGGAQLANAEVIYTALNDTVNSDGSSLSYDLNGDGKLDVRFDVQIFKQSFSSSMSATVRGLNGAGIRHDNLGEAVAFNFGQAIGANTDFNSAPQTLVGGYFASLSATLIGGLFLPTGEHYVGVRFPIHHTPHFGWLRVNVEDVTPSTVSVNVHGMAFEACRSEPIEAGRQTGGAHCQNPDIVPEPAT
jgi:hypothetical protein